MKVATVESRMPLAEKVRPAGRVNASGYHWSVGCHAVAHVVRTRVVASVGAFGHAGLRVVQATGHGSHRRCWA